MQLRNKIKAALYKRHKVSYDVRETLWRVHNESGM